MNEDGTLARIEEKYLGHGDDFDYVDTRTFLRAVDAVLPQLKPLFEKYAEEIDWRLLAAIAYQESHWDAQATSPTGVRGMMMLTKNTAQSLGITDRTDAEQSISGGVRYLQDMMSAQATSPTGVRGMMMLTKNTAQSLGITDRTDAEQSISGGVRYLQDMMSKVPESVPENERIWFALAAYNMGYAHMLDARALTAKTKGNPDSWADVKQRLPLLSQKPYYSKLTYGYARGHEAYAYVENIRKKTKGNPDSWADVKQRLPLLSQKPYYSKLTYGYARGHEAYAYVENIRKYQISLVGYLQEKEKQATEAAMQLAQDYPAVSPTENQR